MATPLYFVVGAPCNNYDGRLCDFSVALEHFSCSEPIATWKIDVKAYHIRLEFQGQRECGGGATRGGDIESALFASAGEHSQQLGIVVDDQDGFVGV